MEGRQGGLERCPKCGGRGWIVEPDGGAGSARPCPCQKQQETPRLERLAGLPERYASCRLESFHVEVAGAQQQLLRARTIASRYVEEFVSPEGTFRESGLLFVGPPGVGKTHLAAAVLRELIRRYHVRGRFVDFTSLIYEIQATFDASNPDSKQSVLDPVIRAEVLVLDELGAQKPTAWVSELLYLVLNSRYTQRLPTIFTTNYRLPEGSDGSGAERVPTAESLATRVPAMLLSRLFEMAQPVVIESVDYRQKFKMYQHHL